MKGAAKPTALLEVGKLRIHQRAAHDDNAHIHHLLTMLANGGKEARSEAADDRMVHELNVCLTDRGSSISVKARVNTVDKMGLLCLLMSMDDKERINAQVKYAEAYPGQTLDSEIRKKTQGVLQAILLSMMMPPAWVWARVIYEACCGGWTGMGLGTDEETLTAVIVLNWHRRQKLCVALETVYFQETGKKKTMQELITSEIENVNFRKILLSLLGRV